METSGICDYGLNFLMTMSCLLISHRLSTYFKCCVIMTFKETIIMAGIKKHGK